MTIHKGSDLIALVSAIPKAVKAVRSLHGLSEPELYALAVAFSLQTDSRPFYDVPRLAAKLSRRKDKVYTLHNSLKRSGLVALSHRSRSVSKPDSFHITGQGERVLRGLVRQLESIDSS